MSTNPDDALASMIANLKEKTGKTLEQWVAVAKRSGGAKHGEIVKVLKADHGLGHGYANLIAHETLKSSAAHADAGDLVAAQYAGKKAGLKPIYDALLKAAHGFGKDVEAAPMKAYVSLRRSKQFAILQPSTAERFDLGLNLKGVPAAGRLEAAGSWNSMCTHRVKIASAKEVDADVKAWLKKAYEGA
jgi:hypothetical protein